MMLTEECIPRYIRTMFTMDVISAVIIHQNATACYHVTSSSEAGVKGHYTSKYFMFIVMSASQSHLYMK